MITPDLNSDSEDDTVDTAEEIISGQFSHESKGLRLDHALVLQIGELSRARVQALVQSGALRLNEVVHTRLSHKVNNECFSLSIPPAVPLNLVAQDLGLTIIYEDEHLLVVNKPAGMAVHPGAGVFDQTLVNGLLFHCGESLLGIGGVLRPGIVHRLDKETSGLLVVAKSDLAHQSLSQQFHDHTIDRVYEALVRGAPGQPKDRIETLIGRSAYDRKKMAVLKSGGRNAITYYALKAVYGQRSKKPALAALIECQLETGRTHQIRVHMAHIGHGCLGDPIYGSALSAGPVREIIGELNFVRQALHARRLGFVHPQTQEKMVFEINAPPDFSELRERLEALG